MGLLVHLLEIIMDTNAIINAAMQQLVSTVADEVIRRLQIQGAAEATLAPETLAASLLHLLEFDADIREAVRDCTDEKFNDLESQISRLEEKLDDPTCNVDISDNDDFTDLKAEVESLKEQVESLEATPVDADDSDFADAVRSVIRNHI
jgi:polyhydroxyalkanoate synthesis regulator phasin